LAAIGAEEEDPDLLAMASCHAGIEALPAPTDELPKGELLPVLDGKEKSLFGACSSLADAGLGPLLGPLASLFSLPAPINAELDWAMGVALPLPGRR